MSACNAHTVRYSEGRCRTGVHGALARRYIRVRAIRSARYVHLLDELHSLACGDTLVVATVCARASQHRCYSRRVPRRGAASTLTYRYAFRYVRPLQYTYHASIHFLYESTAQGSKCGGVTTTRRISRHDSTSARPTRTHRTSPHTTRTRTRWHARIRRDHKQRRCRYEAGMAHTTSRGRRARTEARLRQRGVSHECTHR
jgi:hypothetical protein